MSKLEEKTLELGEGIKTLQAELIDVLDLLKDYEEFLAGEYERLK